MEQLTLRRETEGGTALGTDDTNEDAEQEDKVGKKSLDLDNTPKVGGREGGTEGRVWAGHWRQAPPTLIGAS